MKTSLKIFIITAFVLFAPLAFAVDLNSSYHLIFQGRNQLRNGSHQVQQFKLFMTVGLII